MRDIKDILAEYKEISDYQLSIRRTESSQLFFCHKSLEMVRNTDVTEKRVTVFVLHDGKIGSSTFQIFPSTTEEELHDKIKSAIDKAKLINNEVYKLPSSEVGVYELNSNMKDEPLAAIAQKTADAVFSCDVSENSAINALEIFVNKHTYQVVNSKGIDKTQISYKAMIEAIPTWNGEEQSVELYMQYHFGEFDPNTLKKEVNEQLLAVKARYEAIKPDKIENVGILLHAEEIGSIIHELSYDLSYSAVYSHSNKYSIGDVLQNGDCDKLNVTLRGRHEGSTRGGFFDSDGSTLKDREIIENGIIKANFGSNRFAQYLKEEATGDLRCAELKPGSVSEGTLKEKPYLECVSLSGIQVDLFNDYIGGEIRLGYYFDGEKLTPVTGITMSGKLSDVLNTLKLSSETTLKGAYLGPKLARLEGLVIA